MKDDLYYIAKHGHYYARALEALGGRMVTVDAASTLLGSGPIRSLFREWHYSPQGNAIVAEAIHRAIEALIPRRAAAVDLRHVAHR
jgi:hypothetical protein